MPLDAGAYVAEDNVSMDWLDVQEAARPTTAGVTLDQFVRIYIERGSKASGKASWKDDEYLLGTLCDHRAPDGRRLGQWPLTAITEDELEAFHAARRAAGRAASTLNHLVQVLKASFEWAARKGQLARSPISDGSSLKRVNPSSSQLPEP